MTAVGPWFELRSGGFVNLSAVAVLAPLPDDTGKWGIAASVAGYEATDEMLLSGHRYETKAVACHEIEVLLVRTLERESTDA